MKKDIILAGVGGQGILTIAGVIGAAALAEDLWLKQAEVHGMSQRGGDVQSNLRLSSDPIYSDLIPLGQADLIISMEPMEALRYLPWLAPEGRIVANTTPFANIEPYPTKEALEAEYARLGDRALLIDADGMARAAGNPRSANIALLGAAAPWLDIDAAVLRKALAARFASKGDAVVEQNLSVFEAGAKANLIHNS